MRTRNLSLAPEIEPAALRVEQAAAYLGVGQSTIYGLLRDGDLEQLKVGRSLLIPRASLNALLDRASKRNTLPKAG